MTPWTGSLPWPDAYRQLGDWAARRWQWDANQEDWPSALLVLFLAEEEGHTALPWSQAPVILARRFPEAPVPRLPSPDEWPVILWQDRWLVRFEAHGETWVQTVRWAEAEQKRRARLRLRAQNRGHEIGNLGQDAAAARFRDRLLVIAGGPGTGKTTTVKALVSAARREQPDLRVAVAAPTGRAAARAKEGWNDTSVSFVTLHRLLGLRPGLGTPWHHAARPLPYDLVVIDEVSMLDGRTADLLLDAVADSTRMVLVGDPDQLPSVEPGAVLADLLADPPTAGAVVRLTHRHRLDPEAPTLPALFDAMMGTPGDELVERLYAWGTSGAPDFQWIIVDDDEDPTDAAVKVVPPSPLTRETLNDVIWLSPVRQGAGSVESLTRALALRGGHDPRGGDSGSPWMINRNLGALELTNGDRGVVITTAQGKGFVVPEQPDRVWPFSAVSGDGDPAWAVTVHKSQGSEYREVVLVLPPAPSALLVRELVYTGLTRARKRAVLVASRKSVSTALQQRSVRWTGLRAEGGYQ